MLKDLAQLIYYQFLKDHPEVSASIKINPEPKFFLKKEIKKHDIDNYEKTYFNKTNKKTKYLCKKKYFIY